TASIAVAGRGCSPCLTASIPVLQSQAGRAHRVASATCEAEIVAVQFERGRKPGREVVAHAGAVGQTKALLGPGGDAAGSERRCFRTAIGRPDFAEYAHRLRHLGFAHQTEVQALRPGFSTRTGDPSHV